MSTTDSLLLMSGAAVAHDFIRKCVHEPRGIEKSERYYPTASRATILVVGLIAFVGAIPDIDLILRIVSYAVAIVGATFFFPLLIGLTSQRLSTRAATASRGWGRRHRVLDMGHARRCDVDVRPSPRCRGAHRGGRLDARLLIRRPARARERMAPLFSGGNLVLGLPWGSFLLLFVLPGSSSSQCSTFPGSSRRDKEIESPPELTSGARTTRRAVSLSEPRRSQRSPRGVSGPKRSRLLRRMRRCPDRRLPLGVPSSSVGSDEVPESPRLFVLRQSPAGSERTRS